MKEIFTKDVGSHLHGKKVILHILDMVVNDCKVYWETGSTRGYLCTNNDRMAGDPSPDKFGYKYSYSFSSVAGTLKQMFLLEDTKDNYLIIN
jgi:hypothetical protein